MPEKFASMKVCDASDIAAVTSDADMVFCAVDLKDPETKALEEAYAKAELPVISNNKANRWTPDVPMIIPEINAGQLDIIETQKKRLGTRRGFIVTKPNARSELCAAAHPLLASAPTSLATNLSGLSCAGKTFRDWPDMLDNVIPYIGGEEEKSEREPLRIWGGIENGAIVAAHEPIITTQCIRVPVTNGHLAAVFVSFERKPSKEQILQAWAEYKGEPQKLGLPSAPAQFITYFEENDRPQTKLDRDIYGGMGVTAGRLREDAVYDWKFVGLSHNTLRGAAGGSVLTAELLAATGRLQ